MRVLLTGHEGFIGRAVHHELNMRHHWVRPFIGDVRNEESVARQVRHQDIVVHLAAKTPGYGIDGDDWFRNHNVLGAITVAEACRAQHIPMIFPATRVTEGAYGRSKAAAEEFLRREFRDTVSFVRVSMAYGPGQQPPPPYGGGPVRLIPNWICASLVGQSIVITGNVNAIPDLVYVDDVANAYADLVESRPMGAADWEVYGPGNHPLAHIAAAVEVEVNRQTGRPLVPIVRSLNGHPDPPRPDSLNAPRSTELSTGLRRTVAYYRGLLNR